MQRFKAITTLSLIAMFGLSACATDEFGNARRLTDAEKGAIFGAAAGAVVGGAASKKKNRGRGVLLGAVGGGLAGGAVLFLRGGTTYHSTGSRTEDRAFFGIRKGATVAKLIGGAGAEAKHADESQGNQGFELFHGCS